MLNFHHFSPAISTCVLKCVFFDDGRLLFIMRNVLFGGHHNEGKFSNINSLGSMINMLSARGENRFKYSGANLYFKIEMYVHVYLQGEDNTYSMYVMQLQKLALHLAVVWGHCSGGGAR